MPHWAASAIAAGMRNGPTREEAMWRSSYAEILQLVHVEMTANGAKAKWVKSDAESDNDTTANIAAIKSREFDYSWQ